MEHGVIEGQAEDAPTRRPAGDAASDSALLTPPPTSTRTRRRLALDLTLLGIVGVVLVAAIAAAFGALQREFYSPTAFVERYLEMLEDGHATEALAVPGVAVASADLDAAGLTPTASDALLRSTALSRLTDARVIAERADGAVTHVDVAYTAGGYDGTTTFDIASNGSIGLAPVWRFATSPLAVLDLEVGGSMIFDVNGFTLDKRQVSPDGVDADPTEPVSLLVFSPGLYSVSVDTAMSATPGVAVLSDSPFTAVPVSIQAEATDEFVEVVQERVEEFLDACATQEVLQPTACPFGFMVEERITTLPKWRIETQPTVQVVPDGAGWRIPAAAAAAHIDVDIQSLFDGTITSTSETVPFMVTGSIRVLPDGSVTISVGSAGSD